MPEENKLKIRETFKAHDFNIDEYTFLMDQYIRFGQLKNLINIIEEFIKDYEGAILDDTICFTYRWDDFYEEDRLIIDFNRYETQDEYNRRTNKELQHRLYIESEAKKLGLIKC